MPTHNAFNILIKREKANDPKSKWSWQIYDEAYIRVLDKSSRPSRDQKDACENAAAAINRL